MKLIQRSGILAHFGNVPYPQVILAPPGVRSMQRDFMKAYHARAKAQAKEAEVNNGVDSPSASSTRGDKDAPAA
jgi:hypothetical protein